MEAMEIYEKMATKIIAVQEAIIGPLAIDQAQSVDNLTINWSAKSVTIMGDGKQAIEDLIKAYQQLFGSSSVEVSKEAVSNLAHMLQPEQLPELLLAN